MPDSHRRRGKEEKKITPGSGKSKGKEQ